MSLYEKRFFKLLNEQDPAEAEKEAMLSTLDKGTDPSEFDVDQQPQPGADHHSALVAKAMSARQAAMVATINEWTAKIDEFVKFLNSQDSASIQSVLAKAEPDTIIDKMKHSEQRKLARVATELASLAETFRGYIAQSSNPNLLHV